jgi:ABC-type bacteriocin/lantibiotic exporter with double-glycine peptidase domain
MVTIQWALFFWKTKAMKDVTAYIEDIGNVDVNQGILLLTSVFVQLIFQNYFEEHTFTINFHCGHAFQQSVDALIMKKMLRLTAATSKNYETGQIHAIKGCSHRLIWLVWELNHLMMLPINIVTFSFYLYYLVGVSFIFGMSLLGICFFVDRRFRDAMHELHFDNSKLNEKKSNLTNEAFESIRAIKLYGWDEYFH